MNISTRGFLRAVFAHETKVVLGLWLAVVISLEVILVIAMSTPAQTLAALDRFPAAAGELHRAGRPTLVLFAHPKCPCTSASIEELARVMAHINGQVDAYVFFLRPDGVGPGWEKTSQWYDAASIPGVIVACDEQGKLAATFQASTSGATFLYDGSGRLIFSGGITSARGHAGDNDGSDAILAAVLDNCQKSKCTNIFGCTLLDGANETVWKHDSSRLSRRE